MLYNSLSAPTPALATVCTCSAPRAGGIAVASSSRAWTRTTRRRRTGRRFRSVFRSGLHKCCDLQKQPHCIVVAWWRLSVSNGVVGGMVTVTLTRHAVTRHHGIARLRAWSGFKWRTRILPGDAGPAAEAAPLPRAAQGPHLDTRFAYTFGLEGVACSCVCHVLLQIAMDVFRQHGATHNVTDVFVRSIRTLLRISRTKPSM